MILDCHIHIKSGEIDPDFNKKVLSAGVDGGVLLSLCPDSFSYMSEVKDFSPQERVNNVMNWSKKFPNFYPFFWIDPLEEDALEQVQMAKEEGIKGFKVISNNFYPYEDRPMEVYTAIAKENLPILFHSGILYDGTDSSRYHRPTGFESLLEIADIRFALAHVSWPWHDELIAMFGKFQNTKNVKRSNYNVDMFIDLTPGTPIIYREEVLTKLHKVGYDVKNNIIFGTDCQADNYRADYAKEWIDRDNKIYEKLNLDDGVVNKIYKDNLLRFING